MTAQQKKYQQIQEHLRDIRAEIGRVKEGQPVTVLRDHWDQQFSGRPASPTLDFEPIVLFRGHYGKIYAMDWGTDSTQLVSASQDGNLMLWNALTGNKKLAIRLQSSWVMACAFSPTQSFVACGGLDNVCSVYRLTNDTTGFANQQPYRELQQHEGYLSCCRFVDDGQIITSSGDSTCILWDIESKNPICTFYDHTGDVMSVSVVGNSNIFVSGSCDATAKVWDFRTGACVGTFTGHQSDINAVCFFPDESGAFGTGSDDSTCRLFDLRAYQQINVYQIQSAPCGVTSISFSQSGKSLFAGYDDEPFCLGWDTTSAENIGKLTHQNRVSSLGVAPNGQALGTASWDCTIRLWA